jgi:predicted AlkP superfamily pyrophosphatase or phosphodiesterase
MFRKLLIFILIIFSSDTLADKPKLILQITVDQLRGDMVSRFGQRFGAGGFRYLVENGTVYRDAWYAHANTMTAVGHATLATGGNTPQHGIAANDWYDRRLRRRVNAVEDPQSPIIGGTLGERSGRSPRNVIASTFSDELVLASDGRSRSFGVSTKDRGAIILAGRNGQAYWYSRETGRYVTSTWYRDRYPEWVDAWNGRGLADRYAGATWGLVAERDSYIFADQDERLFERSRGTLGVTFPHRMSDDTGGSFYSDLRYTPWADELILSFTEALIAAEQVGQRGATDYLSISFSATDHVGHAFGPNSLEAEDNLLRLDRVLARLFTVVDAAVGLEKTLIVLSSDHGVQAAPEALAEHGFEAGRLGSDDYVAPMNAALSEYFQTGEKLVAAFQKPGLYLDHDALQRAGLPADLVAARLAREIVQVEGFGQAFTRQQLLHGPLPDDALVRAVRAGFYPARSGDVYVVPDPSWYFGHSPDGDTATHGTPWAADRHVPLIFVRPGVEAREINRRVAPRDVAPTLSAVMGILPPSASVGHPLVEVLGEEQGQ